MLGIRVIFFMGNGRRVRFWLYKWCDNELLRHSFPSLFDIFHSWGYLGGGHTKSF